MPDPSELLDVALEAARAGGRVLVRMRDAELSVATKRGDLDLVTQVDRAAEGAVLEVLRRRRPDDGVLAEESGSRPGAGLTWIVDPLDGTTNFTHRLPHYAVSVAVYDGERGLAGVVYDPVRDECFAAAAGGGARLLWPDGEARPLRVGRPERLERTLVATGFAYRKHGETVNLAEFGRVLARVQGIRRAGAATLDLAYVAAGRLDGFWEYRLGPWDTAAGAVLVREAGGEVTTVDGGPWSPWSPSVAAGHPETLARLLPIVRGETGGGPERSP